MFWICLGNWNWKLELFYYFITRFLHNALSAWNGVQWKYQWVVSGKNLTHILKNPTPVLIFYSTRMSLPQNLSFLKSSENTFWFQWHLFVDSSKIQSFLLKMLIITGTKMISTTVNPANIYLFKVNNRNNRKRCDICLKLTTKTPDYISHLFLGFLLLTLNK